MSRSMKKLQNFLPDAPKTDSVGSFRQNATPGKALGTSSNNQFLTLIAQWHIVVGDKMAKVTRPLKLQQDTLVVASLDPLYSSQLMQFHGELLKRLHHNFGQIADGIKKLNFRTTHHPFEESPTIEDAPTNKTSEKIEMAYHPHDPKFLSEQKNYGELLGPDCDDEIVKMLASLSLQTK